MKRNILIVLFLMAYGIAGFSQTGVFTGVLGKPVKPLKHDLRETGLVIRPELGMVAAVEKGADLYAGLYVSGNVNIGYQFSSHFYAGGGCGLWGIENIYVPLYASIRCYWLDKPSSPFIDFNAGVIFPSYFGALFNLALGYDIKNFDIKIGALATGQSEWNWGLFLTFGYNFTTKKQ